MTPLDCDIYSSNSVSVLAKAIDALQSFNVHKTISNTATTMNDDEVPPLKQDGSRESPPAAKRVKIEKRSYKDPLRELHPSTAAIRAGYHSNLSERAVKPPVFRCSTFEFASAEEGELFFQRAYNLKGNDGQAPGLVYSRLNNPNTEIFEDKMVAVERGSKHASAFPSGMSAISTTIMALIAKGGHIIYTNPVYGGTALCLYVSLFTCPFPNKCSFSSLCPSRHVLLFQKCLPRKARYYHYSD